MEVIWLTEAREQMRAVYAYGKAVFGRKVAMEFRTEIYQQAKLLADFPYLGPIETCVSDLPLSYRSLVVHRHYKLIYRIDEARQTVYISALWDTRRNPAQLGDDLPFHEGME